MKRECLLILFILFIPLISADIISLNSGGNKELVINSGGDIEGFFACFPTNCSKLGYDCNSWGDGCGGTLNCGSCASDYSCNSGVCTYAGGGGGGGGGGTTISTLTVIPQVININLVVNTNKKEIIKITNNLASSKNIPITQSNLDGKVILQNDSITIAPKSTIEFEVIFVAPDKEGIYTGEIIIDGKKVLVTLNVKTKLLLFDSNIIVLNPNYQVVKGKPLRTSVKLIPMGDEERLDVTLNYTIQDYSGNVFLTQSETLLIEEEKEFEKNFDTGSLPLGDYIVGLVLTYPNGVAPSSAHFKVVLRTVEGTFGILIFFLIIGILLVLILIILLLIFRANKDKNDKFK